jgi:hypothetical protein
MAWIWDHLPEHDPEKLQTFSDKIMLKIKDLGAPSDSI